MLKNVFRTVPGQEVDQSIHIDLAYDVVKALFDKELPSEFAC
jgi:hypothetical protein